MSLHAELKIGMTTVGYIEIVRRTNLGQRVLAPETVSEYLVLMDGEPAGLVRHKYGDGAWILLRRAVELIDHDIEEGQLDDIRRGGAHKPHNGNGRD